MDSRPGAPAPPGGTGVFRWLSGGRPPAVGRRRMLGRWRLAGLSGLVLAAAGLAWTRAERIPSPAILVAPGTSAGSGEAPPALWRIELDRPASRPRAIASMDSLESPSASWDGRRVAFSARRGRGEPLEIWEVSAEGSSPRRRTLGGDCLEPSWLPDGRIVYARGEGGGDPAHRSGGPAALHVAGEDGAGERRITFGAARDRRPSVLPDGRIVFRRTPLDQGRGKLLTVNPDGTGLALFHEPPGGASVEDGPWTISERVVFLESSGPGTAGRILAVSVRDPLGNRETVARGPEITGRELLSLWLPGDPDAAGLLPGELRGGGSGPAGFALAAPRPRPPVLTSIVDERKTTGTFLCLDVHASTIPEVARAERGSIRSVRVLDPGGRTLLEAPVEKDGSFLIEVPADRPVRLEVLGPSGPLAGDGTGIWVRPNENRGCIGCHEDPELSPENRVPLAVERSASAGSRVLPPPPGATASAAPPPAGPGPRT